MIGGGGREHALCWKLSQSPHIEALFAAPGNAGIGDIATCLPADLNDVAGLATLASSISADLTVIGPEAPLVAGVAEAFSAGNLKLIGPSREAAKLEGSKIFAKRFMRRHSIPTARFSECDSPDVARAAFKRGYGFPVVVKADGLAAGKGVRIVLDEAEFESAIKALMVDRLFGDAGNRVLVEECLSGDEASVMLFTDGRDFKVIAPARDYKRVNDGDQGPNTGGMGSFSTPGLLESSTLDRITREIVSPTLEGLNREGNPFQGVLYVGLMLTSRGPHVIEFNVRLGDPETQAVLMRLESDLFEIFESIAVGRLGSESLVWSDDSSVCVVAASAGYPGEFEKAKLIEGLSEAGASEGVEIFHAGTARDREGGVVTSGGRVLAVTARASALSEARTRAYDAIEKISFEGIHYRKDIAAPARTAEAQS